MPVNSTPIAKAVILVKKQATKKTGAKNSIRITKKAMIQERPAFSVSKSIVLGNPCHPNQPNNFWAPCGNTAIAKNTLAINAGLFPEFVINMRFIIIRSCRQAEALLLDNALHNRHRLFLRLRLYN